MDYLVPFLHRVQVLVSAAQHLVQGAIGEILRLGNVVKTDADGGVFEDRTEELLALLQGFLGTLAFRDIFLQVDEVLWLAYSVPEQLEPPVASNDASVRTNEVLFILVRFSLSLDEFRISLRAGDAFLGVNNFVPLLYTAQLFCPIAQHLVECSVGEMLLAVNLE